MLDRQLLVRSRASDEEREEEREQSIRLEELSNVREERQISFAAALQTEKENIERYCEEREREHGSILFRRISSNLQTGSLAY